MTTDSGATPTQDRDTPVADAMETLRDAAHEWRVEQSRRGEVTVSFDLPLSSIERDVPEVSRV